MARDSLFSRWTVRLALCASLCLAATVARADVIDIGVLSFDPFIPGGDDSPGINAFNIANFTGAFSLPPDFPVADSLTFQGATLTLFPSGQSSQVIPLGDVGPGFLFDINGNPLVQVPGDQLFTGAEFTATLSTLQFVLADGSVFKAHSLFIDAILSPSNGSTLSAGDDQALITVSGSVASAPVPEPSGALLLLTGVLFCLVLGFRRKRLPSSAGDPLL